MYYHQKFRRYLAQYLHSYYQILEDTQCLYTKILLSNSQRIPIGPLYQGSITRQLEETQRTFISRYYYQIVRGYLGPLDQGIITRQLEDTQDLYIKVLLLDSQRIPRTFISRYYYQIVRGNQGPLYQGIIIRYLEDTYYLFTNIKNLYKDQKKKYVCLKTWNSLDKTDVFVFLLSFYVYLR